MARKRILINKSIETLKPWKPGRPAITTNQRWQDILKLGPGELYSQVEAMQALVAASNGSCTCDLQAKV